MATLRVLLPLLFVAFLATALRVTRRLPRSGRIAFQKWSYGDDCGVSVLEPEQLAGGCTLLGENIPPMATSPTSTIPQAFANADLLLLAPTTLPHLGDHHHLGSSSSNDDYGEMKRRASYNLNVGRALETLRKELPMVFAVANLDFSIFANQIMVVDQRQNKAVMPKNLYAAAVKSMRMAAAISSMYPSMQVKKIEYIESDKTIQCLVDVVLPDSVLIDGQAVWEGMFYFGLDAEGLINSHTFDRQISTKSPQPQRNTQLYPWLRSAPVWTPDMLSPVPDLVRATNEKGQE